MSAIPLGAQQSGPQMRAQSQVVDNSTSPVTVRFEYTGEAADNAIGGVRDGASYMNQALAQIGIDTETAFGWPGGRFDLEGFYENRTSLDAQYVGAIQDPSVIDASGNTLFRVYQAFYSQTVGTANLLVGIYDLQTEFGETKTSDLFFNGAYGWTDTLDQSGRNGPSTYPDTALALRLLDKLGHNWRIRAAVLDGVPNSIKQPRATAVNLNKTNGALLIGELDWIPDRWTKLMAGGWGYTGNFPKLGPAGPNGSRRKVYDDAGGYVGGSTRLYSVSAHRGLDAFMNAGVADGRVQIVDASVAGGLAFTGPFAARPFDRLGLALGLAHAGSPYQNMQRAAGDRIEKYETNFELTYRAPLSDWLTMQPDIQYWVNPGVEPTSRNDLLVMLHLEVSHLFKL